MPVFLEAVKFNHDPESATSDALNIRKNETMPVTVPEWRSDKPLDSLAAYAISETLGNKITIQAKFKLIDSDIKSLEIRAIDPASIFGISELDDVVHTVLSWINPRPKTPTRNVLGRVKSKRVAFDEHGDSGFQTFELDDVDIWNVGVSVSTTIWQWQYRLASQDGWTNFDKSRHRIYTVLKMPKRPWRQRPWKANNVQLPWADVLEHACDWASNVHTLDEAAARVTHGFRDIEKFVSLEYVRSPSFYAHPTFNCTKVLSLIRGLRGEGHKLNCTDGATIVSTLANVLGCALWQSSMTGFQTNPIRPIGSSVWKRAEFSIHDVAWKGACLEDDEVYDVCLQVDGDSDPVQKPTLPLLPVNLKFGQPNDKLYRFRVAIPSDMQRHPDAPHPDSKRRERRPIGAWAGKGSKRLHGALLQDLKANYEYLQWGPKTATRGLFIDSANIVDAGALYGWERLHGRTVETSNWPLVSQSLWFQQHSKHERLLRVDVDVCSSEASARYFFLQRLGQFRSTHIKSNPDGAFGDVSFAKLEDDTILFARGNMVVMLRNAGESSFSLEEVAASVDDRLIRNPAVEGEPFVETDLFVLTGKTYQVNQKLPLTPVVPYPAPDGFYKFFSSKGHTRSGTAQFLYQPTQAGDQEVFIFATDSKGRIFRQVLELTVLPMGETFSRSTSP